MKRKIMIPVICCLLAIVCLSAACDPNTAGSSGSNDLSAATGNVLFGGDRPNYDDIFDYDADYIWSGSMDPDKVVKLTMDPSSPVKFAGGETTLSVKNGLPLTADDFDLSGLPENMEVAAIAEAEANGSFERAQKLQSYRVPYEDTTIMACVGGKGYSVLDLGSGIQGGINHDVDQVPGSITQNKTIRLEQNKLIKNERGDFELGAVISEPNAITADSAFRIDSSFDVEANVVYEFRYVFENRGTEEIHLQGYQIGGGVEYRGGASAYKDRYRIDIELQAGESLTAIGQYKLSGNKNFLSYFVASESMRNGMKLGLSASVKKTALTEPETVNIVQKYDLTLAEGKDVTFADGKLTAEVNDGASFPVVVNKNESVEIVGWYDVKNPSTVWESGAFELRGPSAALTGATRFNAFTMPTRDLTVAPIVAPTGYRPLIAASDSVTTYDGQAVAKRTGMQIFETDIGEQIGGLIDLSGTTGQYFRFVTSCSSLPAGDHTFRYIFFNLGETEISFKAHQVNTGVDTSTGKALNGGNVISIAPGQSVAVTVEDVSLTSNQNVMTFLSLADDCAAGKLGVVMSIEWGF